MSITAFSKMHGLGNDFVVVDAVHDHFDWPVARIRALADRHSGIGFDQLLIIEAPPDQAHDFAYRIYNADGSEVEHCGNGARCFGKYIRDHGLCPERESYRVAVKKGSITIAYRGQEDGIDQFCVEMGEPDFTPLSAVQQSQLAQTITNAGETRTYAILSIGNPHAVTICDDLERAPVAAIGSALQQHPLFPERVNVGFMQILKREHIRLRVYERGVGETQACGTGACAAVASGIARSELANSVRVDLQRGSLQIDWQGKGKPLYMTGPAETIYHGRLA